MVSDMDECKQGTDNCHDTLAECINTDGSFKCQCIEGYSGDGVTCVGERDGYIIFISPVSTGNKEEAGVCYVFGWDDVCEQNISKFRIHLLCWPINN